MGKKGKAVKAAGKAEKKKAVHDEDLHDDSEMESEEEDGEESHHRETATRKKSAKSSTPEGSVYKIIEVVGSSSESWEHAAQVAVARASQTLDDLRIAEVVDQDLKIEDGKICAYRTKLRLSFKFRDS